MHSHDQPTRLKPALYKRPFVLIFVAIVVLAGAGFGAFHFIADTASSSSHSQNAADIARNGTTGPNAAQGAASPSPSPPRSSAHKHRHHRRHRPAPTASPKNTPPPVSTASSCKKPKFVTSDPNGGWNLAPYFVYNNAWNASSYSVSQTLYACSYSNWYVVATMNNNSGDGAVKTYPNSHRDFDSNPAINSFHSITSTFAETSPHAGIYEDAYDIWLNGIANPGSTEVMIWNDNHGQAPSGSLQGTATFGGRTYSVWKQGTYVAFVAKRNFTSGTMDLLAFFKWIMAKGWIPANSTLGQVDYGAELVSTNGRPATFSFSNFAVTTN